MVMSKEWNKKHPEKMREADKRYYYRHQEQEKEEAREKRRLAYLKNPQKILLLKRTWNKNNPEKKKEYDRKARIKWFAKNPTYHRDKYKNNIQHRLKVTLRNRLYTLVKKIHKTKRTMDLLGCSTEELKYYLESKFTSGMSWENMGRWHIDHIRPCCSFDLTDPEQQKKCFHFSNLQPLWAKDNLKKGSMSI